MTPRPQTNRDPFFAPLWRRIAVLGACLGWTGFEFWTGDTTWQIIAGGAAIYALWSLFLTYRPPEDLPHD